MQKSFLFAVILLTLLIIAAPTSARSNILEVGPNRPYATIQAAVDEAKQGSEILVYPGYYPEAVTVIKNNLAIMAQGDGVLVEPPDTEEHTAGFQVHADHVTVRGFEIAFGANCAPGIYFEGSHNLFADNYLYLNATCLASTL